MVSEHVGDEGQVIPSYVLKGEETVNAHPGDGAGVCGAAEILHFLQRNVDGGVKAPPTGSGNAGAEPTDEEKNGMK